MPLVELDKIASRSVCPVRVRFCETDLMGIVHHASYLGYFELGRVEWLRKRGVTYAEWTLRGLHLPVIDAKLRYRLPARFDELLEVETVLGELRAASLRFDYRISRGGTLLVEGSTTLACINHEHKVQRFDDDMVRILAAPESVGVGSSTSV